MQNREELKHTIKDSERYHELEQSIWADEAAVRALEAANVDLENQLRELRWKPFTDLSDHIDAVTGDLEHVRSLLNEKSFFDKSGKGFNITNTGLANIALIGTQMEETMKKSALYRAGLEALEKDHEAGNVSEKEYIATRREYIKVIQQSATENNNLKKSLVDMYKTQITNEANLLKEVIENRKKALEAKKA